MAKRTPIATVATCPACKWVFPITGRLVPETQYACEQCGQEASGRDMAGDAVFYKPMHPLKRLRKILADVRQMIRDVRWWNKHRTDAAPFDLGPYLVYERKVQATIDAWGTPAFNARSGELAEAAVEFANFDTGERG